MGEGEVPSAHPPVGEGEVPSAHPSMGEGEVPPAHPPVGEGEVPSAHPPVGKGEVPSAHPPVGEGEVPPAHPLVGEGEVPPAHPLVGEGEVPSAHPPVGKGEVPPAHPLVGEGEVPPAHPLVGEGEVPSAHPPVGEGEVPPAHPPGGVVSQLPSYPPIVSFSDEGGGADDDFHGITDLDDPLVPIGSCASLASYTITNPVTESTLSVGTSDSIGGYEDDLMSSVSAPNLCRYDPVEHEEEEEEREEEESAHTDNADTSYQRRSRADSSPAHIPESVFPLTDIPTNLILTGVVADAESNVVPLPNQISPHSKDRRHRRSQSASVAELLSIQSSAEPNLSCILPSGLPDVVDTSFGSQEQLSPVGNITPRSGSPSETDDSDDKGEGLGTSNGHSGVTNIDEYHDNSHDESHDCSDEDDVDVMPLPHHDRDPKVPLSVTECLEEEEEEEEREKGGAFGDALGESSYSSFEAGDTGKTSCHGDDIVGLSDVDVDMKTEKEDGHPSQEDGHPTDQLDISQEVSPLIERRNLRTSSRNHSMRSSSPNGNAPHPLTNKEVAPVISALRCLISSGEELLAGSDAPAPPTSKQSLERHGSTLSDSCIYNNHKIPAYNLSEHDMSNLDYGVVSPRDQSAGPASLSPLTVDQRSSHGSTGSVEVPVMAQKKYSTPTPVHLESGHQPLRLTLSDEKFSSAGTPITSSENTEMVRPADVGIENDQSDLSVHKISPVAERATPPIPQSSSSPLLTPSLSPSLSPSPPPLPPLPPPTAKETMPEESPTFWLSQRRPSQPLSRDDSHTHLGQESSLDRRPGRPQSAARVGRGSKTLDMPLEFISSEAYLVQRSESMQVANNAGRASALRRESDASRPRTSKQNPPEQQQQQQLAFKPSQLDAIREPPQDSPTPTLKASTSMGNDSEGEEHLNGVAELCADIPELALPEAAWYKTINKQTMRKMKKEERERQEIIHELAYTWKHHIRILNLLDLVFRPQLRKYLPDDVINELFPGLDALLVASKAFDARLERKRSSTASTVDDISDVLLEQLTGEGREELLGAYSTFCSLHMNALEVFKEQMKKKNINRLMKEIHTLKDCQRLTLPDFYQSISQHLTKLVPVMQRLTKKTEALKLLHIARLKECTGKFLDLVASVDRAVREHENHVELLGIHNRLEVVLPRSQKKYYYMKGLSLIAHNRRLRKHGDAVWMGNGKQMGMCMVCRGEGGRVWCVWGEGEGMVCGGEGMISH